MFPIFFLWRYPQAEDFNELGFDGSWDNIQGRCFCRIALDFPAVLMIGDGVGAGWTCDLRQHRRPARACSLGVVGDGTERGRL